MTLIQTVFSSCRDEADEFVEIGALNGIFVLGRSMGFIGILITHLHTMAVQWFMFLSTLPLSGHYLDQKRLKQGLYRHPWDDISYVLPEHMSM